MILNGHEYAACQAQRAGVRLHQTGQLLYYRDQRCGTCANRRYLVSTGDCRASAPALRALDLYHLSLFKPKDPWPYVNHYSFHILDPDWGHLTIKMSGHPPLPLRGSPAAFPCFVRLMKVAALPSFRFSRSSSVLWPPPIPCPALLLRFRVSPLYASLPVGVSSAGPNRASPLNSMVCLCVPPPDTPSRRFGFILAVCRIVAGLASGTQARPGKRSS